MPTGKAVKWPDPEHGPWTLVASVTNGRATSIRIGIPEGEVIPSTGDMRYLNLRALVRESLPDVPVEVMSRPSEHDHRNNPAQFAKLLDAVAEAYTKTQAEGRYPVVWSMVSALVAANWLKKPATMEERSRVEARVRGWIHKCRTTGRLPAAERKGRK